MKRRQRLFVSLACALLAMLCVMLYTSHVRDESERARTEAMKRYGGEVVALVIASRSLEAGEIVTRADIEMRDWLSSLATEGAITNADDVVGREVTVPVATGAPLNELNFRDAETLADIPAGHVAVSVPVTDKLGVATGIAVGSHVAAYRVDETNTKLIAGNATVLVSPSGNTSLSGRGTLTIAVAAKDVPEVLTASTAGDLRLVVPADDVKASGGTEGGAGSVDVPQVGQTPDDRVEE